MINRSGPVGPSLYILDRLDRTRTGPRPRLSIPACNHALPSPNSKMTYLIFPRRMAATEEDVHSWNSVTSIRQFAPRNHMTMGEPFILGRISVPAQAQFFHAKLSCFFVLGIPEFTICLTRYYWSFLADDDQVLENVCMYVRRNEI